MLAVLNAACASTGSVASFAAPPTVAIDCFPSRVVAWEAAEPNPETRFGAASLPGIVLGPPGDSLANVGSTSVASLGVGGSVTLAWDRIVIEDRPGADFTVFENPFFVGSLLPESALDDYVLFVEPARVEVSLDGVTWFAFPVDDTRLAAVGQEPVGRETHLDLTFVAGVTPTLTGDWTVPEDPASFDMDGVAGVSGAGGDAFDLAVVGLSEARFVRITDVGVLLGFPGAAEGFDLDGVVVHHGRPLATPGIDTDDDGLPDAAEAVLYGSVGGVTDSDGDGIDDGREAASCRSAASSDAAPVVPSEPKLTLEGGGCTTVNMSFLGTGVTFDLVRGNVAELSTAADRVELGALTCLADDATSLTFDCDADTPASGNVWFYLSTPASGAGAGTFGFGGALLPRVPVGGCS